MKSIKSLAVAALIIGFSSCNEEKIAELEEKNKVLIELTSSNDSSMNEMLATFNQIQTNLKEIKSREGIIEMNSLEGEPNDIGKSINKDISTISNLMQENEKLMTELNKKLSKSNVKIGEFRTLIKNLENRIDSKNKEIAQLSEELQNKKILIGQLYFKYDSLAYSNKLNALKLENKIDIINKAYYAYGTFKELKEKNVLTKEGGFLGLGKSEELKDDFNTEYFSEVDVRKQTSFLLYAKNAELATTHPENSYKIMGKNNQADSLVITNSEEFWKATRYLVIVVD